MHVVSVCMQRGQCSARATAHACVLLERTHLRRRPGAAFSVDPRVKGSAFAHFHAEELRDANAEALPEDNAAEGDDVLVSQCRQDGKFTLDLLDHRLQLLGVVETEERGVTESAEDLRVAWERERGEAAREVRCESTAEGNSPSAGSQGKLTFAATTSPQSCARKTTPTSPEPTTLLLCIEIFTAASVSRNVHGCPASVVIRGHTPPQH